MTAACQASLSITNSWSLLKPMSIESVMPSNHLILCRLLLLPPSIFPSIKVFANESALRIRWPEYWSFSFNISPSSEHLALISFRMDWLDLLAVQRTLKSPTPQFKSVNSSALSFLYNPTLTSIHQAQNVTGLFVVVELLSCVRLFGLQHGQPHGLQHPRFPCPSSFPRACSSSCPLSRWCHPTISSSVVPFSCLQSYPASGSFLMSWLFTSVGQSDGASTSASVLPMNIQGRFPLGLTGLISLGLSRVFSITTIQKRQFFRILPSLWFNSHIHTWLLEKLKLGYTRLGNPILVVVSVRICGW